MKLCASYGLSGNQGISPYQTNTIYGWMWIGNEGVDVKAYGPGEEVGREGVGDRYITWGGIGNSDLGWEKTTQFDLGLDMSLFDSKLNLTMDVYRKLTTDLLHFLFVGFPIIRTD